MQTKLVTRSKNHTSHLFLLADAPDPLLSVCVIVPARNEAKNIKKTLDALRLQTCSGGKQLPFTSYEVLLLTNNCSDKTFFLAKQYQEKYPNFKLHIDNVDLPPKLANIGTVRRFLMDTAYNRLCANGNKNGIIASTDGDTEVDTNWIYYIKQEIDKGNDAVGGRILTHKDDCNVRLFHLRDVTYRLLMAKAEALIDPVTYDPWPRHFQYFGASLAVTCDMYHKCGRLPEVPYLEDGAFHRLLYLNDAKIRKSPQVKVYTSTRMTGRVEIGFSEQLKKWNSQAKSNTTQFVGSVEGQLLNYRIRKLLRDCWQASLNGKPNDKKVLEIANILAINPTWLDFELTNCKYFGRLWETVLGQKGFRKLFSTFKPITIDEAISQLRNFTSNE